jgi:prefoldin subunit 5
MYAQQVGQQMAAPFVNEMGQPIPAAPSMDSIMAGSVMPTAPYMQQQQMMQQPVAFNPAQAASFVEQPQAQAPFATHEAVEESDEEESTEEAETENADSAEELNEEETESEEESEEGADEARFAERRKHQHHKKHHGRPRGIKRVVNFAKAVAQKVAAPIGAAVKKVFAPKMGKPKDNKRAPSTATPKAAGGRKLPPMPAPLPAQFKINCKKNPKHCIDAETPAEGEEPGDHSPTAVFKKKMEVIKKSLLTNNRNIAEESKWIDQVEQIMKQYTIKVRKVKEHIADERKAIKELLRQRRIILNEKKQKELEARLKMATTELTSLTDALTQVKKKEKELGSGKTQLGSKIGMLVNDLKKLRTDKKADESAALKKAD